MSILARLRAWLGALALSPRPADPQPFTAHDWADLPPYHPDCKTC